MKFYEILQQIMDEKNISIAETAKLCGLADSTVRSIIKRKQDHVALEVAFKISKGLNVSLERLGDMPEKKEKKISMKLSSLEQKIIEKCRENDSDMEYICRMIGLEEEYKLDKLFKGEAAM